ncbi:MAG TPA: hypothetical protein VFG54_19570 [Prolixibacteraceae bacterium]|nr:hypothetical protein [Prolixibacteraceae bacterium]
MNTTPLSCKFILVILIAWFTSYPTAAQKAPIKYGKISQADLEMKYYPSDTSAPAAIICDYGHFNAVSTEFVRTLRIKIFKKEGTVWANQIFPVSSKTDVKGITYNLENGEIVESKLKSESVFQERVIDDYSRIRIAMPNVKEGSVIDMEFRLMGLPGEWRFQEEIPVAWSELIIEDSPYLLFQKNFFGFEPLSINTPMRAVAKDMPAFKKEPYMNAVNNFITKYYIELFKINIPGNYHEFTTSWKAVNLRLRQSPRFGYSMEGNAFINKLVKEIEENHKDSLERLIAAHETVKKAVKWNEEETLFASADNLSYAFNRKIGNSADVNLLLIKLLDKLNFEVYPLALSTRDNGFLPPDHVSFRKLNYVVAYVFVGDKKYFVDATEEFLPLGYLPPRCINIHGRIVDDKKSEWVDLFTDKKDKKIIQYDLKLSTDKVLSGKMAVNNYDYAAFDFRKKYEKFNSKEEYIKDFESSHNGLSVIQCGINNLDSIYLPLKESYEVKIKNMVLSTGDQVFINPLLFEQLTSNPFKSEERRYPVDFIYPQEKIYYFKLELPEGVQVVELPKPLTMKSPDGSASVQYRIAASGNIIQYTYKFSLGKAVYSEIEYADLRAFFSEIVKKHSEQIVLKMS